MTDLLTDRPAPPAPADEDIDEPLRCAAITQITHDVVSIELRPHRDRRFRFEAGQHVTVTVPMASGPVERCYTISSSALVEESLTLTVKRVPGGPVSNWLHDHLRLGDDLQVSGPSGVFTTSQHPAPKHLFLSAGSGITPLMSMLRTMGANRPDVVFVHSARTPADIIFRAELQAVAADDPGVQVAAVCEADAIDEPWEGLRGRLSLPMLLDIAPDLREREIFTCGPPAYMTAVRSMLLEAGVDPARCHEESFVLGATAPQPASALPDSATVPTTTFSVTFARSGPTVTCQPGDTVLQAASKAGLSLPSSCAEGLCGTCKSSMLSGSVDMQHAGGIRPREIEQGKILLCCSTPCEDLVIDA